MSAPVKSLVNNAGATWGAPSEDHPLDLKGAALLLASAAGRHITRQMLAVDGGVSAVHGC